jgi:hypothetical protein
MNPKLDNRRLYIADLAQRQADMEWGREPMNALAYRVIAKRLREATAGFADARLDGRFGPCNPQIREVLENRHFDSHGVFRGPNGRCCRTEAAELLVSLGVRQMNAGAAPRDLR